jgi:hypothetical protein
MRMQSTHAQFTNQASVDHTRTVSRVHHGLPLGWAAVPHAEGGPGTWQGRPSSTSVVSGEARRTFCGGFNECENLLRCCFRAVKGHSSHRFTRWLRARNAVSNCGVRANTLTLPTRVNCNE